MKLYNSTISDMENGWFIGNFEPSIHKTDQFEISHMKIDKGHEPTPHTHKLAMELTYIVSGEAIIFYENKEFCITSGNFFMYEPGDVANMVYTRDSDIIVIKWPSVPNDKYVISGNSNG